MGDSDDDIEVEELTFGPPSPATKHVRKLEVFGIQPPHIKWNATQLIGELGEEAGDEGCHALSRTLLHKESEGYLRWQASQALAQLGPDTARWSTPYLAQALLQRKPGQPGADVFVRCSVAETLGELGEWSRDVGARALAKALDTELSEDVRQRAAAALGQLGEHAGDIGIEALLAALKRDEDALVRVRACASLGQIGKRIGDVGTSGLLAALAGDKEDGVRLQAVKSLANLGYLVGEVGVEALQKTSRKDIRMNVRDLAVETMKTLQQSCIEVLEDTTGEAHSFARGRSARMLGQLGVLVSDRAVEVLAVNVVNDWDVFVRRRAVEGLDQLGPESGELGVAALCRAADADADIYVQWTASQALGKLGSAPTAAAAERLQALLDADLARRPLPPAAEAPEAPAALASEVALPATAAPEEKAEEAESSELLKVTLRMSRAAPLVHEDFLTKTEGALGRVSGNVAFDQEKAQAAFKDLAEVGEIRADAATLEKVLKICGHQQVEGLLLEEVVQKELNGRSFLDEDDFLTFCKAYEQRRLETLEKEFYLADVDNSGELDPEELALLLKKRGISPGTGVVRELVEEVCGLSRDKVRMTEFTMIHTILTVRAGFTLRQYSKLNALLVENDADADGYLNSVELRVSLANQGFKRSLEEVQAYGQEVERMRPSLEGHPEENKHAGLVSEVEFLQISRKLREEEAQKLLQEVSGPDPEPGVVTVVAPDELPDLLLDLGFTPVLPGRVEDFMKLCGYAVDRLLTFEDLCPLLDCIREAEGFSKNELHDIRSVFLKYDDDGSGTISGLELVHMIPMLGFPATFETVENFLQEFDIDNSGELDTHEFMQLMGQLRRDEIEKSRAFIRSSEKKFEEDGIEMVSMTELPKLLEFMGYSNRREKSTVIKAYVNEDAEKADMWKMAHLVSLYRSETREMMEKWNGFSHDEVYDLREEFAEYDSLGTGEIGGTSLLELIRNLFKQVRHIPEANERLRHAVAVFDQDSSATVGFAQFLGLKRIVREEVTKLKLEEERLAIQATRFSAKELRDFREVFRMFDTDRSGDLGFEELQGMVGILVGAAANSDRGAKELEEVHRECDTDNSGELDFAEFLHVLRTLVDRNWLGFRAKLEAASS